MSWQTPLPCSANTALSVDIRKEENASRLIVSSESDFSTGSFELSLVSEGTGFSCFVASLLTTLFEETSLFAWDSAPASPQVIVGCSVLGGVGGVVISVAVGRDGRDEGGVSGNSVSRDSRVYRLNISSISLSSRVDYRCENQLEKKQKQEWLGLTF